MFNFPPYVALNEVGNADQVIDANVVQRRVHPMQEYNEKKFRKRFRITPPITRILIDDFNRHVTASGDPRGGGITIDDRFCLGLRYLATGSNYQVICDYQGLSHSSCVRCVDDVVDYFYYNSHKFIKWPTTVLNKAHVSQDFRVGAHRPRIIGAIDGSHIAIRRPHEDQQAYINRKGYYSLNCLVVSDSNMLISYVAPNWSGCTADAFAYNQSSIRTLSDAGALNPFFLLGDSGFGCHQNLFTPVNPAVTPQQRRYNRWHRKQRSIVERCFGQLKQRWRCLDNSGGYLYHQPAKCVKVITACCCLHNVAQAAGVPAELDHDDDGFQVVAEELVEPDLIAAPVDDYGPRDAYIMRYF